jgi:hypothetical protein
MGRLRLHRRLFNVLMENQASAPSDTTAPTVAITSTETSPSAVLPVPIAFALSEVSIDFAVGDLTLAGCTVTNFAGSGTSYTCQATPTTPNGTFTIDIAANAFHDAAGNGNTAATQFSFTSSAFVLADDFTDTLSAGFVNGTNATPTGGARVAVDTGNRVSVGSSLAVFAAGAVGGGDPGLWYSIQARAAGKALLAQITPATATDNSIVGYNVAQTGVNIDGLLFRSSSGDLAIRNNAAALNVGVYAATSYLLAVIMRATGMHYLIKGGAFTEWTLLYSSKFASSDLYPSLAAAGTTTPGGFTCDSIHIPTSALTFTPIASDAFTRTDGAIGNTGGGGSEESGGTGKAWTAQKGTWAISTNKPVCSALADSVGIVTVDAGTPNVMVEELATRIAGTSGLCLRYTDANNYIKCVHNGTNLQVVEVVAGTPNTLINAAATYVGNNGRMIVSLNGTALRAYYNDILIGVATTAIATGNNHGLFTDDTGATFDNFVIWAKGNGDEYASLDNYINP